MVHHDTCVKCLQTKHRKKIEEGDKHLSLHIQAPASSPKTLQSMLLSAAIRK